MTLRTILSTIWPGRKPLRAWALGLILAFPLAAAFGVPPASAIVQSIQVVPSSPTTCDSVALVVKGVMPNSCYTLLRVRLEALKLLPTMGPVPAYSVGVRVVVQEPNPNLDVVCTAADAPYERKLYLPYHPFGSYSATATEYVVPYSPDSTAAPKDTTNQVETAFHVDPDSCTTPGCYMLSFNRPGLQADFCDAVGPPGGTACIVVSLGGTARVAGLQSVIHVTDPRTDPGVPVPESILRPVSVEAIGEADGFQVNWTADGSTVRFLVYSPEGKVLEPGSRVLRICYAIGSEAHGAYRTRFGATVASDPKARGITPCPTLVEETGRICVGEGGCDLNGDGRSNILDVIRLVRCALGGRDSANVCPDSTLAQADCNEDGHVDVRDVVCCIRNILLLTRWHDDAAQSQSTTEPTRVRFVGDAEYWKPDHANVAVEVDPGTDFGAAGVEIEAPPGARITGIVDQSDPTSAYSLLSDPGDGQRSRFLVVRMRDGELTQPIRAWVRIETDASLQPGAMLRIVDSEGGSWSQAMPIAVDVAQTTAAVTQVSAPRVLPARPNPFTNATDIAFELPASKHVTLRVYSATGKLVRTLVDATVPQGVHRAPWNGRDAAGRVVASGVYFVKLSAGNDESTIRIMRLK